MFDRVLTVAIWGLDLILIGLTVLPLVPTTEKWVRIWDFPRLQIAVLLVIALVATAFVLPLEAQTTIVLLAGVTACLLWQVVRMWPYTRLHAREVEDADCAPDQRIRLLVSNVLMQNRETERLFDAFRRLQPDIALLVETDAWWDRALAPLYQHYAFTVRHPKENSYGMVLLSQLELVAPEVRYLISNATPSIKTGVNLPSGRRITFYGLHPQPPPHSDTAKRDAELIVIAKEIREQGQQAIVAGDLNDVAWSRTTRLFQKISGLLDPRIGRGFYQTFHADYRLARWPLDHVFFDHAFGLRRLSVLPSIGSDHFPLYIELCHRSELREIQPKPRADASDLQEAREVIKEGQDASRRDS